MLAPDERNCVVLSSSLCAVVILKCSLIHKNRLKADAGRQIKLGTLGSKSHLIRVGYGFTFITDAFN